MLNLQPGPAVLLNVIPQYLREGAIIIICRFHFTMNTCIDTCTTDDADGGSTLIQLSSGDLDASVFEGQSPLTLKAVFDPGTYTHASVIANFSHAFIP